MRSMGLDEGWGCIVTLSTLTARVRAELGIHDQQNRELSLSTANYVMLLNSRLTDSLKLLPCGGCWASKRASPTIAEVPFRMMWIP